MINCNDGYIEGNMKKGNEDGKLCKETRRLQMLNTKKFRVFYRPVPRNEMKRLDSVISYEVSDQGP